ncbi:MAG: PAS domain-containing protein [Deltaproteobacteria bacterium]|nr:PAS domain-containing protein [Deltaproteobacteria bacterium]
MTTQHDGKGGGHPGEVGAASTSGKSRRLHRPTPQQVLDTLFELAREASLAPGKQELCGRFMRAVCHLLPGRRLCLRIVDSRSLELTELFAEGDLRPGAATAPLVLKPTAAAKVRLRQRVLASPRLQVQARYEPVFEGSVEGVAIPLAVAGHLHGLLNVEYGAPTTCASTDEALLIALCNQLALALRNLSMVEQTRQLRTSLVRLVDQANALIFATDGDGRVTVFNQALARLVGVEAQDVMGADLYDWFTRQGADQMAQLVADGRRGLERSRAEVLLPGGGGTVSRATFDTTVMRTASDEVDVIVGVGHDESPIESLQRQVIQAEKLATLGQLAAGVVHELNNPLTSIIVYTDFLAKKLAREGSEAADVAKLHKVLEGAERILRVSRDLVAYARPTSDQYDLLSINEVIDQSLSFCEHILKKGKARVVRELASDLPAVYAIRGQLQQVFINLLTNACHAMKDAGGTIAVRTAAGGGGCVVVEVIDDGLGIGEADQPHIYEPFYTTKADGKGSGLGLSIVRNILEKHQGDIQFFSTPGAGTTFRIVLPCGQRPPGQL